MEKDPTRLKSSCRDRKLRLKSLTEKKIIYMKTRGICTMMFILALLKIVKKWRPA